MSKKALKVLQPQPAL